MYLVVGLGNPGDKYASLRHNIGFMTIDYLASTLNVKVNKIGCKAVYGTAFVGGEKVIFAKPQTYMNLSGESVLEFSRYYKIEPSNIIVIYDDIDLKAGDIRIRPKGSAGTHNGMKSIIYQLQTDQFPRVRIGVSAPPENFDLKDYVLCPFREEEKEFIKEGIKNAAQAALTIIKEGVSEAQQLYNKKPGKKNKENVEAEN